MNNWQFCILIATAFTISSNFVGGERGLSLSRTGVIWAALGLVVSILEAIRLL